MKLNSLFKSLFISCVTTNCFSTELIILDKEKVVPFKSTGISGAGAYQFDSQFFKVEKPLRASNPLMENNYDYKIEDNTTGKIITEKKLKHDSRNSEIPVQMSWDKHDYTITYNYEHIYEKKVVAENSIERKFKIKKGFIDNIPNKWGNETNIKCSVQLDLPYENTTNTDLLYKGPRTQTFSMSLNFGNNRTNHAQAWITTAGGIILTLIDAPKVTAILYSIAVALPTSKDEVTSTYNFKEETLIDAQTNKKLSEFEEDSVIIPPNHRVKIEWRGTYKDKSGICKRYIDESPVDWIADYGTPNSENVVRRELNVKPYFVLEKIKSNDDQ